MKEFELFVALRYLRAKRKQAVISVITVDLDSRRGRWCDGAGDCACDQQRLPGHAAAEPPVPRRLTSAFSKKNRVTGSRTGENWYRDWEQIPGVTSAAPTFYGQVMIVGPRAVDGRDPEGRGAGIRAEQTEMLAHLKEGSIERSREDRIRSGHRSRIQAGAELWNAVGNDLGSYRPKGR